MRVVFDSNIFISALVFRSGQAAAAVHGTTLKDAREHDHAATERRLLVEALERFRGNKRAVARHLEIDPKTLYRLLKKHAIFAAGEG